MVSVFLNLKQCCFSFLNYTPVSWYLLEWFKAFSKIFPSYLQEKHLLEKSPKRKGEYYGTRWLSVFPSVLEVFIQSSPLSDHSRHGWLSVKAMGDASLMTRNHFSIPRRESCWILCIYSKWRVNPWFWQQVDVRPIYCTASGVSWLTTWMSGPRNSSLDAVTTWCLWSVLETEESDWSVWMCVIVRVCERKRNAIILPF